MTSKDERERGGKQNDDARDEARYAEEAAHARPVTPEYEGERLIFDALRSDLPAARERREAEPETPAERRGEEAFGIGGAVAGAALGVVGGPLGIAIGGIAGAAGGWWAGRVAVDVANAITGEDDRLYREHYEHSGMAPADRPYEGVRTAYFLGHVARHNPAYRGRKFEEVEPELARGWTPELARTHGEWERVRPFVEEGYLRREQHERLGGSPRVMSPTEAARDTLHRDDTAI